MWLKGLHMVQFECPRHWKPTVSSNFEVGRIALFPLLAFWGNKNWPPRMKETKLENFGNKIDLIDCIWSSLSAPGIGSPLSHPFLGLGDCPFSQ